MASFTIRQSAGNHIYEIFALSHFKGLIASRISYSNTNTSIKRKKLSFSQHMHIFTCTPNLRRDGGTQLSFEVFLS